MIREKRLSDWLEESHLTRNVRASSAYQDRRALAIFSHWLRRPALPEDLTSATVSRWVAWLQDRYAPRTAHALRGRLLTLWRYVADETGREHPRRVRPAPAPRPQPIAWTLDELRAMRAAADVAPGIFRHVRVPRSLYLVTLIDTAYETGLRRSDLWTVTQGQIRPDGSILLRQAKTTQPHVVHVRPETLERLRQLPAVPLACPCDVRGWYRAWRQYVIEPAGVRPGALQQLRRSGATHLAVHHPHEVQRFLGHLTPTMQRHYVDESISLPRPHLPPAIGTRDADPLD